MKPGAARLSGAGAGPRGPLVPTGFATRPCAVGKTEAPLSAAVCPVTWRTRRRSRRPMTVGSSPAHSHSNTRAREQRLARLPRVGLPIVAPDADRAHTPDDRPRSDIAAALRAALCTAIVGQFGQLRGIGTRRAARTRSSVAVSRSPETGSSVQVAVADDTPVNGAWTPAEAQASRRRWWHPLPYRGGASFESSRSASSSGSASGSHAQRTSQILPSRISIPVMSPSPYEQHPLLKYHGPSSSIGC